MTENRLLNDLADALVSMSIEADVLTRVLLELRDINTAFSENGFIASDFQHPGVPKEKRLKALADALGTDVHPFVRNTLLVLLERDLLGELSTFVGSVRRIAKERGSAEANVRSAVELSKAERDALSDLLAKKFDSAVTIHETRDPTLLGGFVVTVGDWRFDGSVKGRIERLTQELYV